MVDGPLPAARVIEKCGGISATAGLLGIDRSVVNRWLLSKDRGGSEGWVPMHHARALREKVASLTPEDFFDTSPDPVRATG